MEQFSFSALLSRMKYITRWGLMRSSRSETLSEHTAEVATLSHLLALLARDRFGVPVRPEVLSVAALYHDAGEIVTGDMPTPVKYKTPQLQKAYKMVEAETVLSYLPLLPDEVRGEMAGYLTGEALTQREAQLLKGADRLSALIKCIEEEQSGNHEFRSAAAQQRAALEQMALPEIDYFIKHMLPAYEKTLDELLGAGE